MHSVKVRVAAALLVSLALFAVISAVNHTPATYGRLALTTTVPIRNPEPLFTQIDLQEFGGNVARPNGMVWHEGKIYVLCAGDQTIYELLGTSGITETYIFGVQDAFTIYAENNADGDLDLWVPDYGSGKLVVVRPDGVETIAEGMDGPWDLIPLNDDTFLISIRIAGTVETITRTGERAEIIGGLSLPTGLVHDGRYLYVANSGDPARAIEWFEYSAGDSSPGASGLLIEGLVGVMNMRLGPDGLLYFAYSENGLGVVGRVDPAECRFNEGCTIADVERVVSTGLPAPLAGLTFSPGGRLFIHERYSPQLYAVNVLGDEFAEETATEEAPAG